MTQRPLGDVVGTDLQGTGRFTSLGSCLRVSVAMISLYQVVIKVAGTEAMDEEGVNLIKRKSSSVLKLKTAMMLNREGTRSRGQEGPVLTALAKTSEVLKGTEVSPETVTILMNEY